MEIDDFSVLIGTAWADLWPQGLRAEAETALAEARAGRTGHFSGFRPTFKGAPKWWDVVVTAVPSADGSPVRLVASSRDVTESVRAQERERFLTEELAHRGKNLLTVVQAIVSRSLSGKRSPAEARRVIESRIQALARSQSTLMTSGYEGVPLADLVAAEFEAFSGRVDAKGPAVMLNARAAQTIALLVHELATNATKHGALSQPRGRVAVDWAVEGAGADARFRFQWLERGGPPVTEPARRGFGSVLIEKAVAQDFGAEPVIEFAPDGLFYAFDALLSGIAAVRMNRN